MKVDISTKDGVFIGRVKGTLHANDTVEVELDSIQLRNILRALQSASDSQGKGK